MINALPPKPNLDQLKHQAKDLLAAHARKDVAANAILRSLHRFRNSTDLGPPRSPIDSIAVRRSS